MVNTLNPFQKNTLFKYFSKGQLNYRLLLRMFCLCSSNNLIDKIHERDLNLTSEINDIPFTELLSIKYEVSILIKNMQTLLTKVHMNLNGLSPPITLDLFTKRDNVYNFRELLRALL